MKVWYGLFYYKHHFYNVFQWVYCHLYETECLEIIIDTNRLDENIHQKCKEQLVEEKEKESLSNPMNNNKIRLTIRK